MLNCLPPETLADILDWAARSTHACEGYNRRQDLLLSCCLISRDVLPVARALLWQVVRIRTVEDAEGVARSAAARGGSTRTLDVATEDEAVAAKAFSLLPSFPVMDSLYLRQEGGVCAVGEEQLQRLSGLHHLALAGVTITAPLPPFPNLVALSLRNIDVPFPISDPDLDPQRFPSLRALHISHRVDSPPVFQAAAALFRQLAVSVRNVAETALPLIPFAPSDMADVPCFYTGATESMCIAAGAGRPQRGPFSHNVPHYLELCPLPLSSIEEPDTSDTSELVSISLRATLYVRNLRPHLCRAIILPFSLSPTFLRQRGLQLDDEARTARDRILAQCAEEGVEVFWRGLEEQGGEGEMLPQREFLAFAVREREKGRR
ncbi:hypothetical protein JCM6882_004448 [Rhodosporidiobolus microsporus]